MKKIMIMGLIAILALFVSNSFMVSAFTNPDKFPTLKFKVIDSIGNPISHASVYISNQDNLSIEYQLQYTKSNGQTAFAIINNTEYAFQVNFSGIAISGHFEDTFNSSNHQTAFSETSNDTCPLTYSIQNGQIFNSTITLKVKLC